MLYKYCFYLSFVFYAAFWICRWIDCTAPQWALPSFCSFAIFITTTNAEWMCVQERRDGLHVAEGNLHKSLLVPTIFHHHMDVKCLLIAANCKFACMMTIIWCERWVAVMTNMMMTVKSRNVTAIRSFQPPPPPTDNFVHQIFTHPHFHHALQQCNAQFEWICL